MSQKIRCKCYENPLIISDNSIKSEAGNLEKQIRNYHEIGMKRIIVLTNFSSSGITKLEQEIKNRMNDIIPSSIELKVLGIDIEVLQNFLDEESRKISEINQKKIEKELVDRIQKVNQQIESGKPLMAYKRRSQKKK